MHVVVTRAIDKKQNLVSTSRAGLLVMVGTASEDTPARLFVVFFSSLSTDTKFRRYLTRGCNATYGTTGMQTRRGLRFRATLVYYQVHVCRQPGVSPPKYMAVPLHPSLPLGALSPQVRCISLPLRALCPDAPHVASLYLASPRSSAQCYPCSSCGCDVYGG